MDNMTDKLDFCEERTSFAEDRTDFAEDRTILSNERTFAGWMRTGLGSVGVGLGFQALFQPTDNEVLAKCAASIFITIGVIIFWTAYRSASKVLSRLNTHSTEPASRHRLTLVAVLFSVGSSLLAVVLWLL